MRPSLISAVAGAAALVVLLAGAQTLGGPAPAHAVETSSAAVLHVFWADGCPHCEAEWEWVADLHERHPALEVVGHEITASAAERELWVTMSRDRGVEPSGVPTTILGDRVWVGFDPVRTTTAIEAAVTAALATEDGPDGVAAPAEDDGASSSLQVPLIGTVDLASRPLLLSTVLIGFVDGFNPCSLWVLSLLLALVLHSGSRRRIMLVGGIFLAVTTALYGVYVAGLLSVLVALSHAAWIRAAMAVVAGLFGLVNIKDYIAFQRGPTMSIPARAKPGIYRRLRRITAGDAPLPAVIGGTALLAVGVSMVETPCTVGLPLVWSNLLTTHGVGALETTVLFGVYMSVFLLDELVVLTVAVVTMRAMRLQERHGRALKLGSGLVMLALAATLIVAPHLLLDLRGTVAVFGGAAAVTAMVLLVERRRATVAASGGGPPHGGRGS